MTCCQIGEAFTPRQSSGKKRQKSFHIEHKDWKSEGKMAWQVLWAIVTISAKVGLVVG